MSNFNEIRNIVASINCHPLGGKHKLKSYYNFAAWQLYCLLNNKPKKVKFLNNTFLMVEKGMAGATGNIYTGLHEFNDMGFLLHFLRKDDLFLDIGANIGSYSILASGQIGCNTISFEPIPSTFNKLKRNISINNLDDKVKAMQVGVGAKKGTLTFTSNLDTINHVNLQAKGEASSDSINVDVVTIDEVIEKEKTPTLIKIDVEGFETEVLNGMKGCLKNRTLKAIIIELNGSGNRYGYDENQIHELLLSHGFNAYDYDPFMRKITSLKTYGIYNTIYIRDVEDVEKRVIDAEKFVVFSEKI